MPRYFLIAQKQDVQFETEGGLELPNDAAAVAYAEGVIRSLKEEQRFNDPGFTMVVEREGFGTVISIPFFPGFAE